MQLMKTAVISVPKRNSNTSLSCRWSDMYQTYIGHSDMDGNGEAYEIARKGSIMKT